MLGVLLLHTYWHRACSLFDVDVAGPFPVLAVFDDQHYAQHVLNVPASYDLHQATQLVRKAVCSQRCHSDLLYSRLCVTAEDGDGG